MKNKVLSIAVLALATVLLMPVAVSAAKGVGIVWDTEVEIVDAGATRCIQYGVYNPWDEPVTAELTVSDEFKDIITNEKSEVKEIPAKTTHDKAIPVELCFKVGGYSEDCAIGNQVCAQTCSTPEVSYSGKIRATEVAGSSSGGTGSATTESLAVPLLLKVRCTPHSRDFTLVYTVAIVFAITAMGVIFFKRGRKKRR